MKKLLLLGLLYIISACGCYTSTHTSTRTDIQEGTLIFKVTPENVDVYVDGQNKGKTTDYNGKDAALKLSAGSHTITLKADGYLDYEKRFYMSDTQELIEVEMKMK
jgi:hypothetical protein